MKTGRRQQTIARVDKPDVTNGIIAIAADAADADAMIDRAAAATNRGRFDRNRDRPPQPAISDLLKEGQEILVQIAKEPIAKKGARITSHIALPGRFLVYMPTIEHLGVSRKIESSGRAEPAADTDTAHSPG